MEALGRLAGGIAHDFNNLLTIIQGRAEILLKRVGGDERASRDLALVRETARRAAALTSQLLAFSRRQVLQLKVLDLNAVVAGMAAMLRRLIGEHIELVLELAPGLGRVKADPAQLDQVILNLAVNARDAMPGGGRLTLATTDVEVDAAAGHRLGLPPGPYVTLTAADTGTGMDAETLAHVFEPFFTTTAPGRGTGLGLATVYGLVRQHEDHVTVASEPGRGTSFRIYLPRAHGDEAAPEPAATAATPAAAPGRGSETILLVEDEDDVRELAREILEHHGYQVLEAADGADGLRICREHEGPIHLVVTDVIMPRMSGAELARQLAPIRPTTRVLYVSGYTDDALGEHGALESGIFLLHKPFTPESLIAGVRAVLDAPAPG